jgi:hypothetical protein
VPAPGVWTAGRSPQPLAGAASGEEPPREIAIALFLLFKSTTWKDGPPSFYKGCGRYRGDRQRRSGDRCIWEALIYQPQAQSSRLIWSLPASTAINGS